jgi:glycine dehydrogenase subunit 2
MKLIFEKSKDGSAPNILPDLEEGIPKEENEFLEKENKLNLPELPENEIMRHFVKLSQNTYSIDSGFYPLGSCTMKYNPKINEDIARLNSFAQLHPYQFFINDNDQVQGALQLMYELEQDLCEITGMDAFTLQPAAGAHGEFTGLMIVKKYFHDRKEFQRKKILVPDSAHGTNPATVAICGFETVPIKSNKDGLVDISDLNEKMSEDVACMMLTNPNTLGLFERDIQKITSILHEHGAIVYCDGANMNAITGVAKPGDMGFDIMHINTHKTFSTPHGGGGPGAGPVGVKEHLAGYLPKPYITREEREEKKSHYKLNYEPYNPTIQHTDSIGRVKAFYGNFGILVRAYTYIRTHGGSGLRKNAENAVLNANYLRNKLQDYYDLAYKRVCMHEFILSDKDMPNKVTTNHIAKRLLDYNQHAPTIYFPLIVPGALMIEPTETENKARLDEFADAMIKIREEAQKDPDLVKNAPHTTPVKKLDAVTAARKPNVKWQ